MNISKVTVIFTVLFLWVSEQNSNFYLNNYGAYNRTTKIARYNKIGSLPAVIHFLSISHSHSISLCSFRVFSPLSVTSLYFYHTYTNHRSHSAYALVTLILPHKYSSLSCHRFYDNQFTAILVITIVNIKFLFLSRTIISRKYISRRKA